MSIKKELLKEEEKSEVNALIDLLLQHKQKYSCFKSFTRVCDDALIIANALINNDIKTFRRYPLKYTNHTAEKMKGILSLSTYKKYSFICKCMQAEKNKNSICSKCYADKSISLYEATLTPALIYNTLLLKYIDIDPQQIPYINNKYFRFEAFSDLQSSKHFKNLLTVCKKNKNTIFTLWTKAGKVLNKMMNEEKINKLPSNLNIVYSEYLINNATDKNYLKELQSVLYPSQAVSGKYSNYIKCFCVFDDEEKRKNSNMYLCKNSCLNCLKCYKKSKKDIVYIAEKLH